MLTIVPTPIGNLKDITLRSIEALESCDGIICEDTRRATILLNHLQIKKPLYVINDFNEARQMPTVIEHLKAGRNICLISDAGTPLVSDPGYKLVRECIAQGLEIDSLPGPSAVITALTLSGMPPDKFMFLGFLPDKVGKISQLMNSIQQISSIMEMTFIGFVSPYKLINTLKQIDKDQGDIDLTLAKELTKIHQSVKTQKISEWLKSFDKQNIKGEWVIIMRLGKPSGHDGAPIDSVSD